MLPPDRRRRMLEHVHRAGSVRIEELAAAFDVSPWTVRRDLDELDRQGALHRTHGGALVERAGAALRAAPADPVGLADPAAEAKARIGEYAAAQLAEDRTVMVLGGSTTTAMLPHLIGRRLTVVTNGLDVAYGLRHAHDVSVVLLGGMLHREQMTLLGPLTDAAMADLHVDVIVGGAYGVDLDIGITGSKIALAGQHHGMLAHSDGLMVLADAGKLGRRGPTVLAGLDRVDRVITDAGADAHVVAGLRARGVAVDVV